MDFEQFLKSLDKRRYFEGYTDTAKSKAIKIIGKAFAAETARTNPAGARGFLSRSLAMTEIDQELMGEDDLKGILRQLSRASCGMFLPKAIKIVRTPGNNLYRLEFKLNETNQALILPEDSWIPTEFHEQLARVTEKHCAGLAFHTVVFPESGQSAAYLWCRPRAYRAIARAGLLPTGEDLQRALASDAPSSEEAEGLAIDSPPPKKVEFPAPADPSRSERMRVFSMGKWKIPLLSQKTIEVWRELTAPAAAAIGRELQQENLQRFDLLCACHCGLTGVGNPVGYAQQLIKHVDRYFYGEWREGYVENEVVLTEATAKKTLFWSGQLQAGCVASLALNDQSAFHRFLKYICDDVYDETRQGELAYYRLLSDVVLERKRWNWAEQAAIIQDRGDAHLVKLLQCLQVFSADDETAFLEAISKIGSKPVQDPLWFRVVVDWDVTILAALASQREWGTQGYPPYLQDRILDWRMCEREDSN
jgi:hypothetical protein